MRRPQYFVSLCVALLCFFSINLEALGQNCANGKCFTPIRSTTAAVVHSVGNTVEYFSEVQPVRTVVYSTVQGVSSGVGLAQQKSQQQAARQTMCHVGGSFGGARYEGVGFSTSSPEAAVRNCCYSNRRIVDQGVAYGYNRRLRTYGWFATIFCN